MGSAGDTVQLMDFKYFNNPEPALLISLSSKWAVGNLTPEHELFHLYQYGYTHFKNRWYLEGVASSTGCFFRVGIGKAPNEKLPRSEYDLRLLFNRSYDAKLFWNKILNYCLPKEALNNDLVFSTLAANSECNT